MSQDRVSGLLAIPSSLFFVVIPFVKPIKLFTNDYCLHCMSTVGWLQLALKTHLSPGPRQEEESLSWIRQSCSGGKESKMQPHNVSCSGRNRPHPLTFCDQRSSRSQAWCQQDSKCNHSTRMVSVLKRRKYFAAYYKFSSTIFLLAE